MQATHGAEHKAAETVAQAQAASQTQVGQLVADVVPGVSVDWFPQSQQSGQAQWAQNTVIPGGRWLQTSSSPENALQSHLDPLPSFATVVHRPRLPETFRRDPQQPL